MTIDPKDITVEWNKSNNNQNPTMPTDTSNMITYLTEGVDLTGMQTASSDINSLIGLENFTKNDNK